MSVITKIMLKEPETLKIPSKNDFYFKHDGEEDFLIELFLGHGIDSALKIFEDGSPPFLTLEMKYIGTKAFCYYVFVITRYLQNIRKETIEELDMSEVYSILIDVLEEHYNREYEEMQKINAYICQFLKWAIRKYSDFLIDEKIYGNIKNKYKKLYLKTCNYELQPCEN